ncbi:predicted protein [Sclerotinia sclerotiorum 1980 UF-70]|uniref:Uncharacterized protein n=1 Tax=Sclerotinia sclerotiorum (strain ATCC 18683 / 1980 / Ss-1) TaxID=665079 RepID=A7EMJ7_SCLS1|nr:predicted protein [Sclerotinia sclerotiorum 1980 UF-70]EDO04063.1 predicted protein [Sclerotinia sclerotiorum 1980 UF-70]
MVLAADSSRYREEIIHDFVAGAQGRRRYSARLKVYRRLIRADTCLTTALIFAVYPLQFGLAIPGFYDENDNDDTHCPRRWLMNITVARRRHAVIPGGLPSYIAYSPCSGHLSK